MSVWDDVSEPEQPKSSVWDSVEEPKQDVPKDASADDLAQINSQLQFHPTSQILANRDMSRDVISQAPNDWLAKTEDFLGGLGRQSSVDPATVQSMAINKGISYDEAYKKYDQLIRDPEATGFQHQVSDLPEYIAATSIAASPFMVAGAVMAPLGTAVGLGASALVNLIPVEKLINTDMSDTMKSSIRAGHQLLSAAAGIGAGFGAEMAITPNTPEILLQKLQGLTEEKNQASYDEWHDHADNLLNKYNTPGSLQAEIKILATENNLPLTDEDIDAAAAKVRNVWSSQAYAANVSKGVANIPKLPTVKWLILGGDKEAPMSNLGALDPLSPAVTHEGLQSITKEQAADILSTDPNSPLKASDVSDEQLAQLNAQHQAEQSRALPQGEETPLDQRIKSVSKMMDLFSKRPPVGSNKAIVDLFGEKVVGEGGSTPLEEKPVEEIAGPMKPTIDTIGANGQLKSDPMPAKLSGTQMLIAQPHINAAIDKIKANDLETSMASGKAPNPAIQNFSLRDLNKHGSGLRDMLYNLAFTASTNQNKNDYDVQSIILKALGRTPSGLIDQEDHDHHFYVSSIHQNKEQAEDTGIFDVRNLRTIPVKQAAIELAYQGSVTDPNNDIIMHMNRIAGQDKGILKNLRSTLIDHYEQARESIPRVWDEVKEPEAPAEDTFAQKVKDTLGIQHNAEINPVKEPVVAPATAPENLPQPGSLTNPVIGDIWDQNGYKVISTNLGGVHGRGLAMQAKMKGLVSNWNKDFDSSPLDKKIITIAVKGNAPETAKVPGRAFSEQTTAGNLQLMASEVAKLIKFASEHPQDNIYVPYIGLGFGEGKHSEIMPILEHLNGLPNVKFIAKDNSVAEKYADSFKPGVRQDRTPASPSGTTNPFAIVEEVEAHGAIEKIPYFTDNEVKAGVSEMFLLEKSKQEMDESNLVSEIVQGETEVEKIFSDVQKTSNEHPFEYSHNQMGELEEFLRPVVEKLIEWHQARTRDLPQVEYENRKTIKDLREKGVDNVKPLLATPVTKGEDIKSETAGYFDMHLDEVTDKDIEKFKKAKIKQYFNKKEDAKITKKMKEGVVANHFIYDKLFIDEINQAILEMESFRTGNKDEIIDDAIKIASRSMKEIDKDKGNLTTVVEKRGNLEVKHDAYENLIDPNKISAALHGIKEDITGKKEWVNEDYDNHYEDAEDDATIAEQDKDFLDGNGDIVEMNIGANPKDLLEWMFKNPAPVWEQQTAPIQGMLKFWRRFPLIARLDDWHSLTFKTVEEYNNKMLFMGRTFETSEKALKFLNSFIYTEDSVNNLGVSVFQPLADYDLKNIKDFYKASPDKLQAFMDSYSKLTGFPKIEKAKISDKKVEQIVFNSYAQLKHRISEQVLVQSGNCYQYAFSENGNGLHKTNGEQHAFVEDMKYWYQLFSIPFSQADIDKWAASRTPDLWKIMTHQNVMNNDSQQRIVLFWKSQIEMPYLIEQIKSGIYANADIWKSYIEGYASKGFTHAGIQSSWLQKAKDWATGKPSTPLDNIKRPQAEYFSQQGFVQASKNKDWKAIDDFYVDNFHYFKNALLGIKQAQLMRELKSLPAPLQYTSKKFKDVLEANPSPYADQVFKVATLSDTWVGKEARRMTHLMFTAAEIAEGQRIASDGVSDNPYEVTGQTILNEAGFIQTKEAAGLNKWINGSFNPPYLYYTLKNEVDTLFKEYVGFDRLPALFQYIQYAKNLVMINAIWHVPQYIGGLTMQKPKYMLKGLGTSSVGMMFGGIAGGMIAGLPGAALGSALGAPLSFMYLLKGLFITGPKILAGDYTYQVGKNPAERARAEKFMSMGSHLVAGYSGFLRNIVDKADKGTLPSRQGFGDNIRDYLLSGLGTGPSVLGEMIGSIAIEIMSDMTDTEMAKGFDEDTAMRRVVEMTNTWAGTLSKPHWQASTLSPVMSIATWSKNFTIRSLRCLVLSSMSTKGGIATGALAGAFVGGVPGAMVGAVAGSKLNKFSSKVQRFRSAGEGAWMNALTGGATPPEDRPGLNDRTFTMLATTVFVITFLRALQQYASSFHDDDKPDEYGETHQVGDKDYYDCKKRFMWNNPDPFSLRLPTRDLNGKQVYSHTNMNNTARGIADILAPIIDQAVRNVTHNPNYSGGGKGPGTYFANKFTALDKIWDGIRNKTEVNGKVLQVWDSNEKRQWAQARQIMQLAEFEGAAYAPSQGWVGSSAPKVPLSEDPLMDMVLRSYIAEGEEFTTGLPTDKNVSVDKARQERSDVAHINYEREHMELNTAADYKKAFEQQEISKQSYRNFFKKSFPGYYEKQNKRALFQAQQERNQNSIWDDIPDEE